MKKILSIVSDRRSIFLLLAKKAVEHPNMIFGGIFSLLNGFYYRIKFLLFFKKANIGKFFRVYGKIDLFGLGSVSIGDNCVIQGKLFGKVTIMTIFKHSEVIIGNNVSFNGTTIICYDKITIGDNSIISNAYIIDSTGHSLSIDRGLIPDEQLEALPVNIGKNVWISVSVVVLHGVEIGDNSVIGACSLVRKSIPPNSLYAGNPLKFIKKIC